MEGGGAYKALEERRAISNWNGPEKDVFGHLEPTYKAGRDRPQTCNPCVMRARRQKDRWGLMAARQASGSGRDPVVKG